MSDGLNRNYMRRRERTFGPPGEFILSRAIVGCVLLATVITALSMDAAATRQPISESATATATTGSCAGLPNHEYFTREQLVPALSPRFSTIR